MSTTKLMLSLFFSVFIFSACVSKKRYVKLQDDYKKSQDTNQTLYKNYQLTEHELNQSKNRAENLADQLSAAKVNAAALQSSLDQCLVGYHQGNVNIAKLVDQINASNKYIRHLVDLKNKSDSLNQILTVNLTRALTPDEIKSVDIKVLKGVVYISLADNMLYKTASYQISPTADSILSKVAKIINDYADYDVLIEGNTDNVPIYQLNIRNNWDLSCLRASSVVQALQNSYNVDPKRLTAGGRGEYNPVAENNTDFGKSLNRRTQIIITPRLDQFITNLNSSK